MKFANRSNQAADYLRQAVPLMVKHNIPPNPLNYALWYTYVSREVPELNLRLDETLKTYGTCPAVVSEQMFREHIISDEIETADQFEAGLMRMVDGLNQTVSDTAQTTEDYSEMLSSSLEAINDTQSDTTLEQIIRQLAASTDAISKDTRAFQHQLEEAQAEIESLRKELHKSRQDAHLDPLTGLFNRRVFDAELQQLADAEPAPLLSLIMVDVDHFKQFNDNYGHLMGDKVLQYVGKLLRESCEEPLLPVRFGGEEFAILCPGMEYDTAAGLAEILRHKIQAIRIRQRRSGDIISSVTASFGVSQLRNNESPTELIEGADNALYRAKNEGRNQVACR